MSNWPRSLIDAETELEDALDGHAAVVEQRTGHAADEIGIEPLVARRDRRVDREDAVAPDLGEGVVERRARRDVLARPLARAGTPSGPR